jgi:hypothetical protein
MHRFSGGTYEHERDGERLNAQLIRVFAVMHDGEWRTLNQIANLTGDPTHSVSARLRDFRKRRFGSHIVLREYLRNGLFRYRLVLNEDGLLDHLL